MKPAAVSFGVGLMSDPLQGGGGYEQILASGFVYWYKQGTTETNVFLLSSHKV